MTSDADTKFSRQWQLIQLLSDTETPLSFEEIGEKIAMTKRSIQRNFALFREYDLPLHEENIGESRKKGFRILLKPFA